MVYLALVTGMNENYQVAPYSISCFVSDGNSNIFE